MAEEIGTIEKANSKMAIKVRVDEYNGKTYADIRNYYLNDDGDYAPTKKGVAFYSVEDLSQAILFLQAAREKLAATGEEGSVAMQLMTKAIEQAAQAQYPKGNDLEHQKVVAKFFNPTGAWTWYLMNQDPADPDYLWGIVKGFEVEIGSFSLSELQSFKGQFGLGIERDLYFTPKPANEVWEKLLAGKHI